MFFPTRENELIGEPPEIKFHVMYLHVFFFMPGVLWARLDR